MAFITTICLTGDYLAVGYDDSRIELFSLKDTQSKISSPITEFPGHVGSINALSYMPSYQLLISGSSDRTIKVWDISNDSLQTQGSHIIQTIVGHEASICSLATFRQFIFSGSDDASLRVWIVSPGREHMIHPFFEFTDEEAQPFTLRLSGAEAINRRLEKTHQLRSDGFENRHAPGDRRFDQLQDVLNRSSTPQSQRKKTKMRKYQPPSDSQSDMKWLTMHNTKFALSSSFCSDSSRLDLRQSKITRAKQQRQPQYHGLAQDGGLHCLTLPQTRHVFMFIPTHLSPHQTPQFRKDNPQSSQLVASVQQRSVIPPPLFVRTPDAVLHPHSNGVNSVHHIRKDDVALTLSPDHTAKGTHVRSQVNLLRVKNPRNVNFISIAFDEDVLNYVFLGDSLGYLTVCELMTSTILFDKQISDSPLRSLQIVHSPSKTFLLISVEWYVKLFSIHTQVAYTELLGHSSRVVSITTIEPPTPPTQKPVETAVIHAEKSLLGYRIPTKVRMTVAQLHRLLTRIYSLSADNSITAWNLSGKQMQTWHPFRLSASRSNDDPLKKLKSYQMPTKSSGSTYVNPLLGIKSGTTFEERISQKKELFWDKRKKLIRVQQLSSKAHRDVKYITGTSVLQPNEKEEVPPFQYTSLPSSTVHRKLTQKADRVMTPLSKPNSPQGRDGGGLADSESEPDAHITSSPTHSRNRRPVRQAHLTRNTSSLRTSLSRQTTTTGSNITLRSVSKLPRDQNILPPLTPSDFEESNRAISTPPTDLPALSSDHPNKPLKMGSSVKPEISCGIVSQELRLLAIGRTDGYLQLTTFDTDDFSIVRVSGAGVSSIHLQMTTHYPRVWVGCSDGRLGVCDIRAHKLHLHRVFLRPTETGPSSILAIHSLPLAHPSFADPRDPPFPILLSFHSDGTMHVRDISTMNRDQPMKIFNLHTASINNIAVSSGDQPLIVTASDDGTICLIDGYSLEIDGYLRIGELTLSPCTSVAVEIDSDLIITGSADCTLRLWRLSERKLIWSIQFPHIITAVSYCRIPPLVYIGCENGSIFFCSIPKDCLPESQHGHYFDVFELEHSEKGSVQPSVSPTQNLPTKLSRIETTISIFDSFGDNEPFFQYTEKDSKDSTVIF
ncbi:hypothetical protein BLNAU_7335 [Blattamonas nauphoetae]|uniref:Uncharacterized protein n=1 Tax=Blattamonas nauphoetae TaxID=2049346 RepID=A0ABQ9Y1T0_9EUKA|nr:hypothetical protein BLNAU_7335 [Blattamonas nauphoetae]